MQQTPPPQFSETDLRHMRQALALAALAPFSTSPNPRVGCVIARGEETVGTGFHLLAGTPHAEVHALRQAADLAQGATAYVSLEPCAHHGRTPPCTQALIDAGISRVVAAMRDPNPQVAGRGLNMLAAAGIDTSCGLLESDARALNRGFLSRIERGRPFVKLKTAASLDGKTALTDGSSRWITDEAARNDVQRERAASCAVLTGIGTVLADNPQLNVRSFPVLRQPVRIVLDSRRRIPKNSRMLLDGYPLWLIGTQPLPNTAYPSAVRILTMPPSANGRPDLSELLALLAAEGIGELMVEAGAELGAAFLAADCVDEIIHYQSAKILGDPARSLFRLPENPAALRHDPLWQTVSLENLGSGIKWRLQRNRPTPHQPSSLP